MAKKNDSKTKSRYRRRDPKKEQEKELSELSMFDKAAKKIFSIMDNSYVDKLNLNAKDQEFRDILNRELEISKGYSNGSIVDFVHSVHLSNQKKEKQEQNANKSPNQYVQDMFSRNMNDVYGYFQNMYNNRFLEMADLEFISKFIPSLGKAVKILLDSIAASDNVCDTINRKIVLPDGISPEDKSAIINEIEQIEKDNALLSKLKSIVYKKSLVTGIHYVYCVSYEHIFEEYDMIKKRHTKNLRENARNQFGNSLTIQPDTSKTMNESYMVGDIDITPAMESVKEILSTSTLEDSGGKLNSKTINERVTEFYSALPNITFNDSTIYDPALESAMEIDECEFALEALKKKMNKSKPNGHNPVEKSYKDFVTPDGTMSIDGEKIHRKVTPTKFNISGAYIKYMNAKELVPIKVFNQVIGYLCLTSKKKDKSAEKPPTINSIGNVLFNSISIGEEKKNDAIQRVIDSISSGILNKFSKKFVTKNNEYKKLISEIIIAKGLTNMDYNIQFIPESDIIPFVVQENEDGMGESVIKDSLGMAKLLLTMLVTRILNYVNKTGNKTVAHIHRGPVNAHDNNFINRVIRDLQDADITFNDLLSPNLVFNKFNRDGNMVIPTTRNGDKIVELEVQEGQQFDMKPEFERELERMMLMGTPVPAILMDYVDSTDFAKQITSARIDLANAVAGFQASLEIPTTNLYRKLCEFSNLTDEQKTICCERLEIVLPRPKVLANSNNADFMSTTVQVAESIANAKLGAETINDTEKNPNGVRIKEELMRLIIEDEATFIDWEAVDKKAKAAKLSVEEEEIERERYKNTNNDMSNPEM